MPIYKLKDKPGYRVEVSYTDSFGRHKKLVKQNKDTLTLKSAKQVEAELVKNSDMYKSDGEVKTLDELYLFYKAVKDSELKVSTSYSNDRRYETRISPYFGRKRIDKITLVDVQNWKNEILKYNYTDKYNNHLYSLFSGILNVGVRYNFIKNNPLKTVGRFKSKNFKLKKYNVWTKEEFEKFIAVAKNKCIEYDKLGNENSRVYWGYYVIFNILFYTGCRKGEVYPLQWSDVDLDNKMLSITKGLIYKVKGEKYVISTPKTKSSIREIPIPEQLVNVLKEHKERYNNVYLFNDSFYICGGIEPIKDTTIENFRNECCDCADVKKIKMHEFRHSHASLLLNKGVNIGVISKRLGHSTITETLNTYSHIYKEKEDEAVKLLESL